MIPNQWYPILTTDDIRKDRPTGARRMGQELVLWRDVSGRLVCQSARCPHKGANLADGRLKGNSIECPYHGFRYGADGDCKAVPCLGAGARIPSSLKIATYPVRELHGLVWLWWGEDREELPEIQAPPEITENAKVYATTHWTRDVHYTRYIESLLEFYHITYVHRDHWFNYIDYLLLYGTPRKLGLDGRERYLAATKIENHKVETEGTTIRYSFDHCQEDDPANSTHYEITFTFPCMVHVRTEQFEATSWLVPVDDGRTEHILRWYEYPRLAPILGSKKLRRLLPWASLFMEKWVQDPQDVRVMERQEPKISAGGINKFVAVDEMNATYLAMRSRLIQEAAEPSPRGGKGRRAPDGRAAARPSAAPVDTPAHGPGRAEENGGTAATERDLFTGPDPGSAPAPGPEAAGDAGVVSGNGYAGSGHVGGETEEEVSRKGSPAASRS